MSDDNTLIANLDVPVAILDAQGTIISASRPFVALVQQSFDTKRVTTLSGHLPELRPTLERLCDASGAYGSAIVSAGSGTAMYRVKRIAPQSNDHRFVCQPHLPSIGADPAINGVLDLKLQGVWELNLHDGAFDPSDTWLGMRGFTRGESGIAHDLHCLNAVHEDDRHNLREAFGQEALRLSDTVHIEYRRRHSQGHWIWLLSYAHVTHRDTQGNAVQIAGLDTEITGLKTQQSDQSNLTDKFQLAIKASGIGIWEFNPENSQVYWDDRMLEIYGIQDGMNRRSEDLWETYLHPEDREALIEYAEECQRRGEDFNRDYRIIRPSGEVRTVRSIARFIETKHNGGRLIGVNIDVTEDYQRTEQLEIARRKLEHDSRHDALTGLANRRMLDETVETLRAEIKDDETFAVLHLDLDHFKQVNDTLGHAAGDSVLVHVAEKLTALVTPQDLICRVGGDEFVILVRSCTSRESLSRLAENIIEIAQTPFFHDGNECRFGTSVGIALHTGKIPRRPIVFANADLSLYAAKRDGRGTYKFFKPSMAAKNQVSLTQRKDLFDALTNGEIICHFQPQYSADTYDIVGAEALVRWESPKRGLMDATSFMPVAQQAGLNARVDEAMLELVLQAQDAWRARGIRYPQVSLNLSRERLYEASFRSHLESRINLEHRLSFELLETAFLDGLDGESLRNLDAIRDVGFSLELDDFGSGRSSVVALQSIAPDRVKIDRALTLPIVERPGQLLILDALSKIARLEQAEIVIEGMETDAHVSAIRAVDCDALQGFAFSYPLSFDDFTDLLEKQTQGGRTFPNLRRHG